MQSPSSLRTVAREGVSLMQAGQMVQLVAPGDCDQDLPAWDTAFEFFDVLTASLTFNLGQPPGCLIERRYPATQWVYDCGGAIFSEDAPDLWSGLAALGYGEGDFEALCTAVSAAAGAPLSSSKAEGPDTAAPSHPDRLWWRAHRLKDFSCVDKKILGVDERPPLIVLTGFLGSGKTSFLQHFVEYQTQRSRFVAVIQNEIGAIGLDGKLLDYTVTEIDEGCVCCSLAGNLKRAVRGILEDFSPDYIILETSGLANPKNLLDDLGELEELVRRDATVTVVDALNFPSSLADCAIAADQVAAANVLLLNKCDLVGAAQLEAVKRQLAALNAAAPVCLTRGGNVHPALIFDAESGPEAGDPDSAPGASQPAQRHRTHSADGWRARTVTFTRTLDRRRFLEAIDAVSAPIFRIKGIIDLSDPTQTLLFQYVAGRYELSVFPDSRVLQRFLTLIGQAAAPGILRRLESRLRAAEL
jgi:G3E family GTPase